MKEPSATSATANPGPKATLNLRRIGVASWCVLGIIALVVVAALALGAVSGILIPLVVAVIISVVLEPLVARLTRMGVPSTVAVFLALLVAILVGAGTITIVIWGVVDQWSDIYGQALLGWRSFTHWVGELDIDPRWLEDARTALESHTREVGLGALASLSSTFYGAITLLIGIFFALFFLFFALRDADRFPAFLARMTGADPAEINGVVSVTRQSVRGYFRGTALTAVLTAPIFMVPLVILGVPLAIPIFVLYFFLSFIPFVGAWITGAFVVLIALGSNGPTAALILAITFVISNGTVQSAVSSWALGSSLQLHPMAVLLATMVAGTAAGLLGMVLGAPLLAATVKSVEVIRTHRSAAGDVDSGEPDADGDVGIPAADGT
ncbi:AI-2E family transporter [Gordonia sp. 852002-50816_SCH5313054-c]|uniref:AI-2E family transporter n=1 Tax=unclassified Gordonia (in: high G+C Gram-positive bacteria) TaxID=2657482 RepID=UPI0007EB7A95|nr:MULTISPECIES: AI-2E family transporter [unclassified Gordonia (in: high G+C Gram-positive bacteria)]OBC12529.1 AI-2E family transporter [Gordonia sp. 852002-50816_SCH5313054-a]OBC19531.1 AI-2E family transporter [Gordonia sp. 852002-50816_SCH5313054-c]